MYIDKSLKILLIFLLGFLSANIINFYFISELEIPYSSNKLPLNQITMSSNFINPNQIEIFPDRIVIYVNNASLGYYASTKSMLPILDSKTNGIRIKPNSEKEINIGDIITFKQGNHLIIHRVIEKSLDENGIYFITKGDNNDLPDKKIRFKDIEYITIGVLW